MLVQIKKKLNTRSSICDFLGGGGWKNKSVKHGAILWPLAETTGVLQSLMNSNTSCKVHLQTEPGVWVGMAGSESAEI